MDGKAPMIFGAFLLPLESSIPYHILAVERRGSILPFYFELLAHEFSFLIASPLDTFGGAPGVPL
jgi:hypothetical protein